MPLNPILIQQVKQAMASKRAFVPPGAGAPPGGDPAAMAAAGGAPPMDPAMMGGAPPMDPAMMGGAPPMDPAMMGGAPPMDPAMMAAMGGGGAPPMDPAMMGGAPPMDPAMMGGAPPAPPAPSAAPSEEIKALIQAEIQKAMSGGGGGGEAKPKSKGAGKIDPGQMIEYMERQQKLLINLYESLGLNLPYDILDKPSPEGGDAKQEDAPPKEQQSDTNVSGIPPIKPIEPIGGKQASIREKAAAARYLLAALKKKG